VVSDVHTGEDLRPLRAARTLGVVSDTHGNVANTQHAVRLLESFDVDAVLHCGDIGSVRIPAWFAAWPTFYVLGNVDWQTEELASAVTSAGGVLCGRFGSATAGGRRVAWLHGDDTGRLATEIARGDWDLICHGHTHQAHEYRNGKTLVLNPGALHRAYPPSIAIVQLDPLQVHVLAVA
jgi:hypothetical protein